MIFIISLNLKKVGRSGLRNITSNRYGLKFCAEVLSRQNRSPLKSVLPDQFWQKIMPKLVPRTTFAAKLSLAGPVLAAKFGPPLPILVPSVKYKSGTIYSYC